MPKRQSWSSGDLSGTHDSLRQGLTVVSRETSGGNGPRCCSHLSSCDGVHDQ